MHTLYLQISETHYLEPAGGDVKLDLPKPEVLKIDGILTERGGISTITINSNVDFLDVDVITLLLGNEWRNHAGISGVGG